MLEVTAYHFKTLPSKSSDCLEYEKKCKKKSIR